MSRLCVDNLNFYIDCLYLCIDTNSTKFKREISLRRLACSLVFIPNTPPNKHPSCLRPKSEFFAPQH